MIPSRPNPVSHQYPHPHPPGSIYPHIYPGSAGAEYISGSGTARYMSRNHGSWKHIVDLLGLLTFSMRTNKPIVGRYRCVHIFTHGWMDGWMDAGLRSWVGAHRHHSVMVVFVWLCLMITHAGRVCIVTSITYRYLHHQLRSCHIISLEGERGFSFGSFPRKGESNAGVGFHCIYVVGMYHSLPYLRTVYTSTFDFPTSDVSHRRFDTGICSRAWMKRNWGSYDWTLNLPLWGSKLPT